MLVGGCAHRESQYTPSGKHFTTDVMNRMTPVKDQGESETCWIYAMLATIETEHLSWGDSVNLSPYYIEKMIEQEANEFARSVCKPGEYIALMSDDSKPYYETSELEVPDNWTHEQYLNIPMDSLLVRTERSVSAHHGVCWEDKGHAMAIVGLAHDEDGEQYFIMKNSWGDSGPYGGLEYVSYQMFCSETIAVEMTKEAYSN